MRISDAQRDVRTTFLAGYPGQLAVSALWLASAALASWGTKREAIVLLCAGGVFIFPGTQLLLRLMRRPASLPKGHPMNALAMQIAFIVPLNIPLVLAATAYRLDWFYPACMILVGTHYMPFVFLYGMTEFGALAALLIGGGLAIGLWLPASFSLGAWVSAAVFLGFALAARRVARAESA
ncbi:MAG TPA: hypothetical protein VHX37_10295 [Acidobacteriaceae bacterium]|nr:hypothetical protein [Acidobacteriaceae bacterium]